MNKYIYAEGSQDFYPQIRKVMARSYNEAIEKLIESYQDQFEDDNIANCTTFIDLQSYLNENHGIDIGEINDIEEL